MKERKESPKKKEMLEENVKERNFFEKNKNARKNNEISKGQTTMIFIILIIIIFLGMASFLLSLGRTVSQSEYLNLFAHDLLSSLLKTDTGPTDPSCKTVSDVLACSFLSPTYVCGGQDCFSLAQQTVNEQVSRFALIKEGFRFLLTVEPEGFVALPQGGGPYTVEVGDCLLYTSPSPRD